MKFRSKLRIIIDTREQTPWAFPDYLVDSRRGTLKTGDYALEGDSNFAIERKSLDDFLGTISSGWERFCRELDRMDIAKFPAKMVIVEGDYEKCCFREVEDDILPPEHNHPRLLPQFVNSRIAELMLKGVCVMFAGNSYYACALACSIFYYRNLEIINND